MDTKQFKKILKESLSTGASFLFEEEEVADEENAEDGGDSPNLTEMSKQLLALIDISKKDLEEIKASNQLNDDNFAKAMAYYYVARYYDDQENFSMSLNTPRDFDRSIKFVLQEVEKAAENVVCFFDEVVMWSMKSKMYANPQSFVEKLQQKTDEETFRTLSLKLSDNHKNKFKISSSNSSLLKKLIASLPKDFDLSKCGTSKARVPKESVKLRTKKQQPMSLESLKATIKKTDARDYATKIITALKQDMKDLRVKVNEAREKTPLLTNTIKALQSIPDKEIQKAALKSILDFFKVNKLQIDDKTKSDLIKSDILVIQKKAKQKKQQPGEEKQDEESDEATEEFEKLDLKVGDVVVVKNRNGKEIVTTIAEIPDELIVKENQWKDETVKFIIGGDWSIPLDGRRGFNSKGQHWIAIRDKKVAIRKATTQDIQKAVDVDPRVAAKLNFEDTLEDAETEEIPREDVETYGTPEDPQAFRPFLKGLEKVPVIRDYADEIVTALKSDIPSSRQVSLMPSTIDELLTVNEEEEQEAKYKLPDSENIQNIIKKIADDKLVAGKWAYTLIKRFLSRNGMDLKQNAEINMKALRVIPKPADIVPLLKTAKAVERNLEEQRYNMLLKRFNIK